MREELLQERKKAIYGLICDELYVPMKAKEIAAVLNVPKSDRRDLAEVLDALVAEGKVEVSLILDETRRFCVHHIEGHFLIIDDTQRIT